MAYGRIKDARLLELKFLSELEKSENGRPIEEGLRGRDRPTFDMVIHLLDEGFLNGIATTTFSAYNDHYYDVDKAASSLRQSALYQLLHGHSVNVVISHKGRVRLAELEQALLTGRASDPTGLMISKRHLEKDLAVAVLSVGAESPLSVAYLDMNGLKALNDTHGHAAGDTAIRVYLQTISGHLDERCVGYRGDGGDEVVLLMRSTTTEHAASALRRALRQLGTEKVDGLPQVRLSASCGLVTTVEWNAEPNKLMGEVDAAILRAKDLTKKHQEPRPSTLAIEGHAPELIGAPRGE